MPIPTSSPTTCSGRYSSAWAPTARSGPTRTPSRSSARKRDFYAQGYFVYDSKKSGAMTISHLRFGPRPIRSAYLIRQANFVACHQFIFLEKFDVLDYAKPGAVFLLNSPFGKDEVWDQLPREVQEQIIDKKLKFYVIDALQGGRATRAWACASTPSCRRASSPFPASCRATRPSPRSRRPSRKPTARSGEVVVSGTIAAVDQTLAISQEVKVPGKRHGHSHHAAGGRSGSARFRPAGHCGDDGRQGRPAARVGFPGRRHLARRHDPSGRNGPSPTEIPMWDAKVCIQCNKCAMVCPHAAIRAKVYDPQRLQGAAQRLPGHRLPGSGLQGLEVYPSGSSRGLHRLQSLRDGLPGQGQEQSQAQGHQHDPPGCRAANGRRNATTCS